MAIALSSTASMAALIGQDREGIDAIDIRELPRWQTIAVKFADVLDALSAEDESMALRLLEAVRAAFWAPSTTFH